MKNFDQIGKFPEVLGAALTDASGALIDTVGQVDGEISGAIHAYIVSGLTQAGNALGIGSFERGTLTAPLGACLIFAFDGAVLGVNIRPNKPTNVIEKKILDTLSK